MATYPTGIFATTNIQATDSLGNPDHATGHNNINDELNAIQTVLGTTSATVSNVIGSLYGSLSIVTANTTLNSTTSTLVFNTTVTTTLTLPSAATFINRRVFVKNGNTGAVSATTQAGQFLISKTSATVTTTSLLTGTPGQWATLMSNGTDWHIIAGS